MTLRRTYTWEQGQEPEAARIARAASEGFEKGGERSYWGFRAEQFFEDVLSGLGVALERSVPIGELDPGWDYRLPDGRRVNVKGSEYDQLLVECWKAQKEEADAYFLVRYRQLVNLNQPGWRGEEFWIPGEGCWIWRDDLVRHGHVKRLPGSNRAYYAMDPKELMSWELFRAFASEPSQGHPTPDAEEGVA